MEKIKINPNRLQWCCNTLAIDMDSLSKNIKISKQTLEQVMDNQAVLTVKQLEKIANFFKRSLLFFLDQSDIQEEKIYSIQFRTINNQEPIHSPKLRAFIERIEKQRQVYLNLLEDLKEPIEENWHSKLELNTKDIKKISANIRTWLHLPLKYDFNDLREAVESKGIMVFISNGYNGKWQIEKSEQVRGFSLYYDILPIIAIRKQESIGAQAFTLMHELAHLLLHKESSIDNEENFYFYQGKEKEANEFAANLIRNYTIDKFQITTFYGYLIGENIEDRDVRGRVSRFEHSYHFDYWFRPSENVIGFDDRTNGSIYTEVIKYSTLLKRAKLRNQIFIDKLEGH